MILNEAMKSLGRHRMVAVPLVMREALVMKLGFGAALLGAGKVTVEKGVITIGSGALTGINWAPSSLPFPTSNYEVLIEAARLKGTDFFAGITFPVGAF